MSRLAITLTLFSLCSLVSPTAGGEPDSLNWEIKLLTVDGNEGIDVADFDKDGQLDVVAGRNWYAAPDFVPRPVRTIEDWNGYVESNGDFALDVDRDGWIDVVAGSFIPSQIYWYRNPGLESLRRGKLWEKRLLVDTKTSMNESQLLHDLDQDGSLEWVVNSWLKNSPMLVWRFTTRQATSDGKQLTEETKPAATLERILISSQGNGHGLGFGDINGDEREDILCGTGWYERPAKEIFNTQWKFHPDWDIHASIPVFVRDLNGDGRGDVIWGKGHDFGLQWWEQLAPAAVGTTQWKTHLIDDTFSQPHSMQLADLDGDGEEELITGKRFYAHNGKDPGGNMQPCLYYFTFNRKSQRFTKHIIDEGTVGTGLQIRTADLNGDGRLDIAVAGKSGTYLLLNQGK